MSINVGSIKDKVSLSGDQKIDLQNQGRILIDSFLVIRSENTHTHTYLKSFCLICFSFLYTSVFFILYSYSNNNNKWRVLFPIQLQW